MAIRLITKETGRILAKVHCIMFYIGKGDNIDGKPYGIIPTGEDDPLGLTFDEDALTVTVNPGQIYCYGRQCIITEKTQALDMHDWTSSSKCFGTLYLCFDLSDIVEQFCSLKLAYGTEAYTDFTEEQNHSNLFKRSNGIYDVPIARFVFDPSGPDGIHFSKYEKVIPELDEQAREATKKAYKIGATGADSIFDNGIGIIKAKHADKARTATYFNDTQITSDLADLWTGQRVKILSQKAETYSSSMSKTVPVKIDHERLQHAFMMADHYHYITSTSTRADICLKLHVFGDMFLETVEADIFIPLKCEIEMKKDTAYYGGLDKSEYFEWDSRTTREEVMHLTVSEKVPTYTLFWFKMTDDGIYWKGQHAKLQTMYNGTGSYFAKTGDIEIVTATISNGKVTDWFYGNQNKAIYVDFLYKGDVNVS